MVDGTIIKLNINARLSTPPINQIRSVGVHFHPVPWRPPARQSSPPGHYRRGSGTLPVRFRSNPHPFLPCHCAFALRVECRANARQALPAPALLSVPAQCCRPRAMQVGRTRLDLAGRPFERRKALPCQLSCCSSWLDTWTRPSSRQLHAIIHFSVLFKNLQNFFIPRYIESYGTYIEY